MEVHVNFLAVLLAAVSSMVIGALWYMPAGFGKLWMKLSGVKPDRSNMPPAKMAWMYGSVFVCSLLTAYVLAHVAYLGNQFFHDSFMMDAIGAAVWLWLGFTAARIYVHDTFENRPWKLTVLTTAHELVTVLVMALIIGALQ